MKGTITFLEGAFDDLEVLAEHVVLHLPGPVESFNGGIELPNEDGDPLTARFGPAAGCNSGGVGNDGSFAGFRRTFFGKRRVLRRTICADCAFYSSW